MPHIDEDELAVIAIGEPASAADDRHLQDCARCRSRLDQLTAVVASTRTITDADRPAAPPASVWAGIEAELGLASAASTEASGVASLDAARRRRSRGWSLVAAAAVVGLLAGSVGTVVLSQRDTAPAPVIVAQASLEPVDAATVRGTAAIERADGAAVLHVSVPDLPTLDDGYYEVWMATPDAATMVAIGTLNPGEEGTFVLPAGMDVAAFPLVDVSVEHFDGDPGHSAVSVVRGQLPA